MSTPLYFLKEDLSFDNAGITILTEGENDNKKLFMQGVFIRGAFKNLNQRVYPVGEIRNAVDAITEAIKNGESILGELDHPAELNINLDRVSHVITKMWMDGSDGYGKLQILPTPSGQIARTLLESGIKLGVSSRGSGNVDHSGQVSDFEIITVDIVAKPSAGAYPKAIYEASQFGRRSRVIDDLAKSVRNDPKAQKHLTKELLDWINNK